MEWVTFNEDDDDDDDDEALSLSDLPMAAQPEKKHEEARGPTIKDDFEFRILGNGRLSPDPHMCAAEDVFFRGKLLPLGGPIRPVTRSDSPGLHSWRSVSSSSRTSNSSCVSRSLSSNSCASSSDAPRPPPSRLISNAFYAFPSPSPRVGPGRKSRGLPARRSTGSVPPVGWGLLRLGVAMAPEIELQDIRVRRGGGPKPSSVKRSSVNVVSRLLGCSCSPEDSISAADVLIVKKKKKGKGTDGRRRERMFDWLEELSIGKR